MRAKTTIAALLLGAFLSTGADERRVVVDSKEYVVLRVMVTMSQGNRYSEEVKAENVTVFTPHSDSGPQWRGNPDDVIGRFQCATTCDGTPESMVRRAVREGKPK